MILARRTVHSDFATIFQISHENRKNLYETTLGTSLTPYESIELPDLCNSAKKTNPMRLTLRTLLAYLDDRLSPGNARELGQKIVQSPFATDLADRIRNVVRRRRLATDSKDHKSIDANLIAEYLDDQLTPELVALIEKEILESDHSLAEVAASHQILGLLSDPVEISDSLRGRLHKIDPFVESKHEIAALAESTDTPEWKPLSPQTTTGRRSPMLLLLLLLIGWLALLFNDSNLFRTPDTEVAVQPAGDDIVDDVLEVNPENNAAQVPATIPPAEIKVTEAPPASLSPETVVATAPTITDTKESNPVVPPNEATNAVASPPASVVTNTTPEATDMKPPLTVPDTSAIDPEPAEIVPPVVNQVFEVRDKNRMHIVHNPDTKLWEWAVSADAQTSTTWGKRLSETVSAVPAPYKIEIVGRDSGWMATVTGGSLFRAVSDDTSGLELFDGRVVLQRQGAGKIKHFSLLTNDRTITIAIPDGPEDRIGVSVTPLPAKLNVADAEDSDDILPFSSASVVTVFAADSPVTITAGSTKQAVTIDRGRVWQWNTSGGTPTESSGTAPQLIPEWVYQTTSTPAESMSVIMAEAAISFRSKATVQLAAAAMSKDRNPQFAAYGVRLSALISDVDQLTACLLQPNEEVVRYESIVGLRRVIRQSNAGRKRVIRVLENRLSNSELENAIKMLEGISRTAAEDRSVSDWLVEMLSSSREALRAMAIENLEALTNERNGYSANDDSGRRATAIRKWERFVENNDGRLVRPKE